MMIRILTAATALSAVALAPAFAQTPISGTTAPAVSQQTSDQWLTSKLRGTNVVGTDDAKIGDVSDILVNKQGQVVALIVGVGGFLGIGEKDVALPMTAFTVVPGSGPSGDRLKLAATKDELKQMAEFKPLKDVNSTTGAAPSGARPATGGANPAGSTTR